MSSEDLVAIEENGDYWLSKSNTAYHIINPNATNLTTIEDHDYYSLAKGGDTYYLLDGSDSSIRLYHDGVGRSMFGPNDSTGIYTPTNVEENPFDGGFLVLAYRNDKPEWNNSSFFNYNNFGFKFNELGEYTGSDLVTNEDNYSHLRPGIEYESLFELDIDNNGVITAGESHTNLLDISGNQHHLDDGHGGDSIILKRENVIIDPNSNGGLNATQVQKSGGHYEVLLEHENVKYDVWKFDASGNFVSSIKAKLWQDEEKFGLNLNGDDVTGLAEIEDNGDVHLKHGDDAYNDAPKYYFVGGSGDPISLTRGGAQTGPNSYNGWSATQVEEGANSGFEVLWSHSDGRIMQWGVDELGSYQSHITATNAQRETTFEVDLDGDGVIGIRPLETNGNYILGSSGNLYYIVDANANSISLTRGGAQTGPNSYNGWSATQVEEGANSGFEVLWSHSDGRIMQWEVDELGSYQSHITATNAQRETTFEVDLDGDGVIGIRPLETNGNYILGSSGNLYYIVDANANSISLTRGGAQTGPNSYNGWSATQVEEGANSGFEVLWSHSDGRIMQWEVDELGSYQSHITATNAQRETTFEVDLDGDGVIGIRPLETNGNYILGSSGNLYYIVDANANSISLTRGGAQTGPNSYNGWSATQVEEGANSGFEVLWSHSDGRIMQWGVDELGSYQSHITATNAQRETTFEVDLDGDGVIGIRPLETNGNYILGSSGNLYYIVDANANSISLTRGGAQTGPNSYNGWSATQVEEGANSGFEVLWSHSDGRIMQWEVDELGSYQSHITATNAQRETTFEVDLDGDGVIGIRPLETNGNYILGSSGNLYYIVDANANSISLTRGGAQTGPNSYNGWSATQVEEGANSGFEVLWSHSDGRIMQWEVDELGSYQSHITATNTQRETTFEVDLNGDGIGASNDNIYGTSGDDTFDAGAGNDTINGREGHDTLIGGDGDDTISGDGGSGYAGNDTLFGNAGNDDLRGRDGNDILNGGTGNDILDGGPGDDTLGGDTGKDIITTGSGLDTIYLRIGDGGNALSDADIITDFTDGSDTFGLTNGLSFGDLTRTQGSGDYANDTIIKYGSEYLAILQNIDVSLLTEADFEDVDIA